MPNFFSLLFLLEVMAYPFLLRFEDPDGTNRYFDLQGRMLNEKPEKGLYIENGKKVINR